MQRKLYRLYATRPRHDKMKATWEWGPGCQLSLLYRG